MSASVRKEMYDYAKENMSQYLDKFQQIKGEGKYPPEKYYEDDWIVFCAYSLSYLIPELSRGSKFESLFEDGSLLSALLTDQHANFMVSWLENLKGYSFRDGNSDKDRKNSFFRLLVRHLRKSYKEPTRDQQKILKLVQEGLNKNTISGLIIEEFTNLWSTQLNGYMVDEQLLKDIMVVNKSKTSRYYYVLHLDLIRGSFNNKTLDEFRFFEKTGLKESLIKLVRHHLQISCREVTSATPINHCKKCSPYKELNQGKKEVFSSLKNNFSLDSKQQTDIGNCSFPTTRYHSEIYFVENKQIDEQKQEEDSRDKKPDQEQLCLLQEEKQNSNKSQNHLEQNTLFQKPIRHLASKTTAWDDVFNF